MTYRPPADAVRDIAAARLFGSTVLVGAGLDKGGAIAMLAAPGNKRGEWLVYDVAEGGTPDWAKTEDVAAWAVQVLAVAQRVAPPADAGREVVRRE